MANLSDLKKLSDQLGTESSIMPLLFVGHGSPMNGIEENSFTNSWNFIGKEMPRPRAIVVISAHWLTNGTYVTAMNNPATIHDFYGFPASLSEVQYPAPGAPDIARQAISLSPETTIHEDHEWGLDHGAWTVLRHMFPDADIPTIQLSIDYSKPAIYHYQLAKELSTLREKGVLVLGSGNMVHNLKMIAWNKLEEPGYGFDWALEMNELFKNKIATEDHKALINFDLLGPAAKLAIPTTEHFLPLIYTLGLQKKGEEPLFFNDKAVGGSLTMTSVLWK
jgi:4,5-DOPA dioxygenase extradiol